MDVSQIKTLIVDDVNSMRVQIASLLEKHHFKKNTVLQNAAEAIAYLEHEAVDLILADWHMEPLNGLDLFHFVKAQPHLKDTTFILLTAESAREKVIAAIQLGIDDYLIKPLTSEMIFSKIIKCLEMKKDTHAPSPKAPPREALHAFIYELEHFASTAEMTLKAIESDPVGLKNLFSIFYERMFAIRGTAQQLELFSIGHIAFLGEEISLKAMHATKRAQIRKCVGSLWDALTTIKYLLLHPQNETGEEHAILIKRLEKSLSAFGGAEPKIEDSEIDALLATFNKG